jgi:hypothetical protein
MSLVKGVPMNTHVKVITVLGNGILVLGAAAVYAGGQVDTTFNPQNFGQVSDSTVIDNQYWPPAGGDHIRIPRRGEGWL